MLYSSPTFLFLFLPAALATYYLFGRSWLVVLAASFLFYAWGDLDALPLLVFSILIAFVCGWGIETWRGPLGQRIMWAGVVANLAVLIWFKYLEFFWAQAVALGAAFGWAVPPAPTIHLPLGVSFFTFQAIAYIVDVHRREASGRQSLLRIAVFKSIYPQLIAGPIVRFAQVAREFERPRVGLENLYLGVRRFVVGLAMKVVIADTMAVTVDRIFALPPGAIGADVAWLGVIAFSLQIFFDFAGYTNMAIGLGLLMGLRLPENFDRPYAAASIQDFWRRWHISLSSWFRDYLYIPLGGSRGGALRTTFNLFFVFLLCGLWHGAAWTFVVWGLWHGLFLALERGPVGRVVAACPAAMRHVYALLVVAIGWAIFRAQSLEQAGDIVGAMFFARGLSQDAHRLGLYLDPFALAVALAGAALSVSRLLNPSVEPAADRRARIGRGLLEGVWLIGLMLLSLSFVAASTHRTFIYFRF